jgi:hypothetical protein
MVRAITQKRPDFRKQVWALIAGPTIHSLGCIFRALLENTTPDKMIPQASSFGRPRLGNAARVERIGPGANGWPEHAAPLSMRADHPGLWASRARIHNSTRGWRTVGPDKRNPTPMLGGWGRVR